MISISMQEGYRTLNRPASQETKKQKQTNSKTTPPSLFIPYYNENTNHTVLWIGIDWKIQETGVNDI